MVYSRRIDRTEGMYCVEPLVQHSNGKFYGHTWQGGPQSAGVFYCLDIATFHPTVTTITTAGQTLP